MPFCGGIFLPILRRYFYAASGRPGRRCFPARFGAAKRRNGKTAAAGRLPYTRGAGGPGRGSRISRRAGAPPANKGRGLPGEGAGFPSAPVRRPQTRGAGGRERGHNFARRRSLANKGAGGWGGDVFLPVSGRRNGKTAKRPCRCVARKQGARAGPGEGAGFPGAAKIARERPSFGQKSQKKSENRASFV